MVPTVMEAAQQQAVAKISVSTVDPVKPVVTFASFGGDAASRIPTSPVARMQRQTQPRRYHAMRASHVDRQSLALGHGHRVGVACLPAHGARRQPGAVLDVRSPVGVLVPEHRVVHMNHDLTRGRDQRFGRCCRDMLLGDADDRIGVEHRPAELVGNRWAEFAIGVPALSHEILRDGVDRSQDNGTVLPRQHGLNSNMPSSRHQ